MAAVRLACTKLVFSAVYKQLSAVHEAVRQLFSCAYVYSLDGSAGYVHAPGAFVLSQSVCVYQADGFKFVESHGYALRRLAFGPEYTAGRLFAYAAEFERSGHCPSCIYGICRLLILLYRCFWHMSITIL